MRLQQVALKVEHVGRTIRTEGSAADLQPIQRILDDSQSELLDRTIKTEFRQYEEFQSSEDPTLSSPGRLLAKCWGAQSRLESMESATAYEPHFLNILDDPDTLLPWEAIDPRPDTTSGDRPFIVAHYLSVRRFRPLEVAPGTAQQRARVLVVCAAPGGISQDEQAFALSEGLGESALRDGRWHDASGGSLGFTSVASASEMRERLHPHHPAGLGELANFNVLHLIAHGRINRHGVPEVQIGTDFIAQDAAAEMLHELLADLPGVLLIVLGVCHSEGAGSLPGQSLSRSLFAQDPTLSVVGMQASLRVNHAVRFFPAFYEELFHSGSVDLAVRAGRVRVWEQDNRTIGWAVPVLYTASLSGVVFLPSPDFRRRQRESGFAVRGSGMDATEYERTLLPGRFDAKHRYLLGGRVFGREKEIRDLDGWLQGSDAGVRDKPILCLCDLGGTGKSHLAWHWINREATMLSLREMGYHGSYWVTYYAHNFNFQEFIRGLWNWLGRPGNPDSQNFSRSLCEIVLNELRERPYLLVIDGLEREMGAFRHDQNFMIDSQTQDERNEAEVIPVQDWFLRDSLHREFLPALQSTRGKVLITSRLRPLDLCKGMDEKCPQPGVLFYDFGPLRPRGALQLWKSFGIPAERSTVKAFLRAVDFHPQVIAIVGSSVAKSRVICFEAWLEAFPEAERQAAFDRKDGYRTTRRHRWIAMATRDLERTRAWSALLWIADKPEASDLSVLESSLRKAKRFQSAQELRDALTELGSRFLIGVDFDGKRADMHPVVRGHIAQWLTDRPADPDNEYLSQLREQGMQDDSLPGAAALAFEEQIRSGSFDSAWEIASRRVIYLCRMVHDNQTLMHRVYARFFDRANPNEPAWRRSLPRLKNRAYQAKLLFDLAVCCSETDEWEDSERLNRRAETLYQWLGDTDSVLACQQSVTWRWFYSGRLKEAEEYLARSAQQARAAGLVFRLRSTLVWLALTLSIRQASEAETLLKGLPIPEAGDARRWTLQAMAESYYYLGGTQNWKRALALIELCHNSEEPAGVGQMLWEEITEGLAYLRLGRLPEARGPLSFADEYGRGSGYKIIQLLAASAAMEYHVEDARVGPGRRARALERARAFYYQYEKGDASFQYQISACDAHLARARVAHDDGDQAEAIRLARLAYDKATFQPYPFHYALGRANARRLLQEWGENAEEGVETPFRELKAHEQMLRQTIEACLPVVVQPTPEAGEASAQNTAAVGQTLPRRLVSILAPPPHHRLRFVRRSASYPFEVRAFQQIQDLVFGKEAEGSSGSQEIDPTPPSDEEQSDEEQAAPSSQDDAIKEARERAYQDVVAKARLEASQALLSQLSQTEEALGFRPSDDADPGARDLAWWLAFKNMHPPRLTLEFAETLHQAGVSLRAFTDAVWRNPSMADVTDLIREARRAG